MLETLMATSIDLFLFIIILFWGVFKLISVFTKEKPTALLDEDRTVDPNHGQDALNFLDRVIKEKYNYHLYLTLMPIYLDRKIPEKKVIKELKEKIYVSVVGSLTSGVKREVLRFFTEKGIELYVHERIIILMNETDFRSAEKFNEAFRDLNAAKVEKILE